MNNLVILHTVHGIALERYLGEEKIEFLESMALTLASLGLQIYSLILHNYYCRS